MLALTAALHSLWQRGHRGAQAAFLTQEATEPRVDLLQQHVAANNVCLLSSAAAPCPHRFNIGCAHPALVVCAGVASTAMQHHATCPSCGMPIGAWAATSRTVLRLLPVACRALPMLACSALWVLPWCAGCVQQHLATRLPRCHVVSAGSSSLGFIAVLSMSVHLTVDAYWWYSKATTMRPAS